MKVFVPIAIVACGVSAALASPPATLRGRFLTEDAAYHMKPVRTIQARVVDAPPLWDAANKVYITKYGADFEEKYRGGMDTVNTASVEGALMYVQAEGIDYRVRGENCTRKNNMKHVLFIDITYAQPEAAVAQFETEYGRYSAMDGGQCTPTSGTNFSEWCLRINGTSTLPKLGAYVGGEDRSTDDRAPYPNTMWFSYPNTCALKKWTGNDAKTAECRASTPVGLCPFSTAAPDGNACTFKYNVLGWVPLDDLVGITALKWSNDSTAAYKDFAAFCADRQVEFLTDAQGNWSQSIDFWKSPKDSAKNAERATKLVELFNEAVAGTKTLTQVSADDLANFKALPTVAELTAANPMCYENIPACATAANGCKRDTYSQVCTVCETAASDCVKAPADFKLTAPVKATVAPSTEAPTPTTSAETPGATPATATPSPTPSTTQKSAASAVSVSITTVASLAVSAALSFVFA